MKSQLRTTTHNKRPIRNTQSFVIVPQSSRVSPAFPYLTPMQYLLGGTFFHPQPVEGTVLTGIFATRNDFTLTLVRLVLGTIFFLHGSQKVFGWFGGYGFAATMQSFTQGMHFPALFAFLAICAEFLGGIALILGFLSRIAALGIGTVMLVAIFKVNIHFGFFMNWAGNQKGEGYEYHLLALAVCVVLLVKGSGALSLDQTLYPDRKDTFYYD